MDLGRLRAIIRKEFRHIRFDLSFLFLSVFAPALLLLLLGNVFTFEVTRINLLVIDRDHSPLSAEYLRFLTADGTLQIIAEAPDTESVIECFRAGTADGALVLPPGFGADLRARREAPLNLLVEASDAGMAQSVIYEIENRSSLFSAEIMGLAASPFTINSRFFFNPNLDSYASMIPGLIPMVLIPAIMAIALSITREMEMGTFETLITTPVKGTEFLLGKLLVHLGLGLGGSYLALGVAVAFFGVPFRGNLLLYGVASLSYLFAMMSICLFLTRYIRSQRAVTTFILMIFFAPSFFLTDLIAPINAKSGVSYFASRILPTTYFIDITRSLALKGVGIGDIAPELFFLAVLGSAFLVASLLTFTKKLS